MFSVVLLVQVYAFSHGIVFKKYFSINGLLMATFTNYTMAIGMVAKVLACAG